MVYKKTGQFGCIYVWHGQKRREEPEDKSVYASGNGGKRKMRLWLKILLLLIAICVVCCIADK